MNQKRFAIRSLFACIISSVFFGAVSGWAQEPTSLVKIQDSEVIEYLFSKAARFSGISSASESSLLPPIYQISKENLNKVVCPDDPGNCRNLAAVFDDIEYRILVLDSFEITQNFKPYDYSFVIHEIVHALQYLQNGPEIFKNCEAVYETEKLAYSVQDRYLKEEGAFERVGHFLRFFHCDEEAAQKDYEKSLEVWLKRQKQTAAKI